MLGTHWKALSDLQIPPDAKTQVRRNVSWRAFLWNLYQSHPSMKNSVLTFHAPGTPECTT
jgi:hypothetical protein